MFCSIEWRVSVTQCVSSLTLEILFLFPHLHLFCSYFMELQFIGCLTSCVDLLVILTSLFYFTCLCLLLDHLRDCSSFVCGPPVEIKKTTSVTWGWAVVRGQETLQRVLEQGFNGEREGTMQEEKTRQITETRTTRQLPGSSLCCTECTLTLNCNLSRYMRATISPGKRSFLSFLVL